MSTRYPFHEATDAHLLSQHSQANYHKPSSSAYHSYPQDITTLMIRNVPRRYTGAAILQELETFVKPGGFNFIYLPWDAHRSANCGFFFVNFISAEIAIKTGQKMNGACWRYVQSSKGITTQVAHLQGLEANLEHYAGTHAPSKYDLHAPMVFVNGSRITFQEAMKQIYLSKLAQESKDMASVHMDSGEASTCSSVDDAKNMAMLSSSSSGMWCTGSAKTDFACEQTAVPMMLTRGRVNQNSQYLLQELTESDALHREAKPFMVFRHNVTSDCIQARATNVLYLPGYHEAWAKMNAQLAMLASIHLKK